MQDVARRRPRGPVLEIGPAARGPAHRDRLAAGVHVLAHDVHEPAGKAVVLVQGDVAFGLVQRGEEALVVVGLQQIVHGAELEGLDSVLVVGGDEDHEGHQFPGDAPHRFKAVHLGHLHVQQEQAGAVFAHGLHGLQPVAAFGHYFQFGILGDEPGEMCARCGLVVRDDGADVSHGFILLFPVPEVSIRRR